MVGAFLYLTACSFKNRLRRRLQRLREPRYVIGLVVGLLYFYLAFFRRGRRQNAPADVSAIAAVAAPVQLLGSLGLLATAAIAWLWPGSRQPLAFSRAEVQLLFTAPVTRRELVHYKLLRSQLAILFGSTIATLVLRPGSMAAGWTLLAGLWVVMMTVRLHLMGVALRRSSLVAHGATGLARQWLPLAVVIGGIGVLTATLVNARPALSALEGGEQVFAELQRLAGEGAAAIVLWPFKALVRLPAAASPGDFLAALPAGLALLALNYVWVLQSDAAFEEASAEHAERQAVRRQGPRAAVKGAAATPFTLAPDGPPETAILWKNLILVGRYVSWRTVLRLLPLLLVIGVIAGRSPAGGAVEFVGKMSLPLAALAVLLGPQMMRNDLRQDLARLAVLKTWPIGGAALIRGQVLAPTVVVTAVAWLLLLTAVLLGGGLRPESREATILGAHRLSLLAASFVLAPAIILAQVVVQNGLAVLFPAWVAVGASRARGIDAIGQRLLMLAGILFALVVSLLPAAAAAGAVAFIAYQATGATLILLPAVVVALVVTSECWLAIEGLGRVLDRTDPSAVEAVE
ncbi:MAG: putative ABC exporter domain-containing protein [Vicinamibacterales bacterium]